MTHRDVIWRTHGPKNIFRILIQNVQNDFELNFKLRTLLSCENSLWDPNKNYCIELKHYSEGKRDYLHLLHLRLFAFTLHCSDRLYDRDSDLQYYLSTTIEPSGAGHTPFSTV